jgi:hypothetical protein
VPLPSSSEQAEQQREEKTQDNRRGQREIETEVPAAHGDVPGQAPERDAKHYEQAQSYTPQADENQGLA